MPMHGEITHRSRKYPVIVLAGFVIEASFTDFRNALFETGNFFRKPARAHHIPAVFHRPEKCSQQHGARPRIREPANWRVLSYLMVFPDFAVKSLPPDVPARESHAKARERVRTVAILAALLDAYFRVRMVGQVLGIKRRKSAAEDVDVIEADIVRGVFGHLHIRFCIRSHPRSPDYRAVFTYASSRVPAVRVVVPWLRLLEYQEFPQRFKFVIRHGFHRDKHPIELFTDGILPREFQAGR